MRDSPCGLFLASGVHFWIRDIALFGRVPTARCPVESWSCHVSVFEYLFVSVSLRSSRLSFSIRSA